MDDVDDSPALLARLDRIGALDRRGADPGVLRAELRALLEEAETLRAGAEARREARREDGGRWSSALARRGQET